MFLKIFEDIKILQIVLVRFLGKYFSEEYFERYVLGGVSRYVSCQILMGEVYEIL